MVSRIVIMEEQNGGHEKDFFLTRVFKVKEIFYNAIAVKVMGLIFHWKEAIPNGRLIIQIKKALMFKIDVIKV